MTAEDRRAIAAGWSLTDGTEPEPAPACAGSWQRLSFPAAYAACPVCGRMLRVLHSAADMYELPEHTPPEPDAPTLSLGL